MCPGASFQKGVVADVLFEKNLKDFEKLFFFVSSAKTLSSCFAAASRVAIAHAAPRAKPPWFTSLTKPVNRNDVNNC